MRRLAFGTVGILVGVLGVGAIGGPLDVWGVGAIGAIGAAWGIYACGLIVDEGLAIGRELAQFGHRRWHRHVMRMRRYSRTAPLSSQEIDTEGEAESPIGVRTVIGG